MLCLYDVSQLENYQKKRKKEEAVDHIRGGWGNLVI